MSLPTAYQVRLAFYGVDAALDGSRREVWALLESHCDRILDEYLEQARANAPFYAELIARNAAEIRKVVKSHTAKLLLAPFDAEWVRRSEERAKQKLASGFDVRTRVALTHALLSGFLELVAKKHRFSGRTAAHLADTATRVLLLDVATAISCHNELAVADAKVRGDQLGNAIKEFDRTIRAIREAMTGAVGALGETSDRLTALAQSATTQASTAAGAASDSPHIDMTAAATEELSAAISEIHGQATRSVAMAREAVSQADQTNSTMRSLRDAVDKIGSVVGLISDIAAQTNLLALNATIEAARGGNRQGFCGGGIRGQDARHANLEGHRGDRPPDRGYPGGDAALGRRDHPCRTDHQRYRHHRRDRGGFGRPAGGGDREHLRGRGPGAGKCRNRRPRARDRRRHHSAHRGSVSGSDGILS